jgi:hypothetical protein
VGAHLEVNKPGPQTVLNNRQTGGVPCGSDVKLALGEFTLEQAAKHLEEKVPMDSNTARREAIAFSSGAKPSHHLSNRQTPDGFETVLLSDRLLYFGDVTTAVSSRGQTVTWAEIRARHDLIEQSRPEWIDEGQTIRVVPLPSKRRRRRS